MYIYKVFHLEKISGGGGTIAKYSGMGGGGNGLISRGDVPLPPSPAKHRI